MPSAMLALKSTVCMLLACPLHVPPYKMSHCNESSHHLHGTCTMYTFLHDIIMSVGLHPCISCG